MDAGNFELFILLVIQLIFASDTMSPLSRSTSDLGIKTEKILEASSSHSRPVTVESWQTTSFPVHPVRNILVAEASVNSALERVESSLGRTRNLLRAMPGCSFWHLLSSS